MDVKIKFLDEDAILPKYARPGDAGLDLTAISVAYDNDLGIIEYGTGIALEIPEGYVGLVYPRSSISKKGLVLSNHVGVIDSGYRGEITFKFRIPGDYWSEISEEEGFEYALVSGEFVYFRTCEDEFYQRANTKEVYALGDRIGQLIIVPYPTINLIQVDELSHSVRGDGGFGSTGN
jgi:dUTP pyrophosphatase